MSARFILVYRGFRFFTHSCRWSPKLETNCLAGNLNDVIKNIRDLKLAHRYRTNLKIIELLREDLFGSLGKLQEFKFKK